MPDACRQPAVEAVRRFSRFYTRRIGVLREGILGRPSSLAEGRVIYELAHHETASAKALPGELGLDPGYLSRILKKFERQGLIARRPAEADARRHLVTLTEAGQAAFAKLNARSHHEIGEMLGALSAADQRRLVAALGTIEDLLGAAPPRRVPYILRPHQPGDLGWIVQRHGALYAEEYGWNQEFEALTAEIVAKFVRTFDSARERCWIAEREDENVGSVLLVRESDEAARLRLLLVEPTARGLGIGGRLVEECLRFARQRGYRRVMLWTNDVLTAARRIYERAGFRLVYEEPHSSFGKDLRSQTWELEL